MMIIFIIFLIPANILCIPSLVKNVKTAHKPTQISMCPSTEPDVKIAKIKSNDMNFDDNRTRRSAPDLDVEPPIQWSYLRQYICGPTNPNCMRDERFNRPDFLKKISKIATSQYDWAAKGFPISKEHFSDANLWNSVNLSGRREGPLYVEEPDFVLVKEEPYMELLNAFYKDDPFIPQRGRKSDIKSKTGNFYNGMLMKTKTKKNSDAANNYFRNLKGSTSQNQQMNSMAINRPIQESKKSALHDICCQQGMAGSNGISKLCFIRCYSKGMKMDLKDVENYDYKMTPQEVELI